MNKALLATLLCCVGPAHAEVVDSAAQGFTLRHRLEVTAAPATAWAFMTDVARWWEPQRRSLPPRTGPRYSGCETRASRREA